MIKIGIICPSEIALRRFMPALQKVQGVLFSAIGIASPKEWFGDLENVTAEQIEEQQFREFTKAGAFVTKCI